VRALPDVPAMSEYLPGYEATSFHGLAAPTGTPPEIITKLNTELNAALQVPGLRARIADLGGVVLTGTPAEFGTYVDGEIEKWAKVIRYSGAKAE
jgi:tripartite-type tricarboxylate transporter receptor subunit TctC